MLHVLIGIAWAAGLIAYGGMFSCALVYADVRARRAHIDPDEL